MKLHNPPKKTICLLVFLVFSFITLVSYGLYEQKQNERTKEKLIRVKLINNLLNVKYVNYTP
jgi:hypothetical protein